MTHAMLLERFADFDAAIQGYDAVISAAEKAFTSQESPVKEVEVGRVEHDDRTRDHDGSEVGFDRCSEARLISEAQSLKMSAEQGLER